MTKKIKVGTIERWRQIKKETIMIPKAATPDDWQQKNCYCIIDYCLMQVGNAESCFVKEMTCYYVLNNGKKSGDCDKFYCPYNNNEEEH